MNGSSHSPTAINGAPSTPNGFSNGPATSSTASLSTHQLPPACGARQLSKLKRFLTTLQQFGNDISPEIGERVRTLVLGLVVRLPGAGGWRGDAVSGDPVFSLTEVLLNGEKRGSCWCWIDLNPGKMGAVFPASPGICTARCKVGSRVLALPAKP